MVREYVFSAHKVFVLAIDSFVQWVYYDGLVVQGTDLTWKVQNSLTYFNGTFCLATRSWGNV